MNDAIFRSLLLFLPLFFFSSSSFSLCLFLPFSSSFIFSIREIPRDTRSASVRVAIDVPPPSFSNSFPFRYSPVGSLGEIDRKLFDIFALRRIRTGDNYRRNHISFHFYLLCSLATKRSFLVYIRLYALC